MKFTKSLFVTPLLCLLVFQVSAEIRKYSNEFLALGAGARGFGMSGAQVASVKDVTAGYWNPAGLLHTKDNDFQVTIMHSEYFAGIAKFDYGAIAIPLKDNKRVFGLSIIRFGVDDIPNTLQLIEPDGTINYSNITTFSAADYAFITSFAQELDVKGLRVGGNAKVIHRKVGHFGSAWGFGLDAGIQYDLKNWTFAAMGRDITGTYNAWTTNFTASEKEVLLLTGNELPGNSLEVTTPKLILGTSYRHEFKNKFSILPELNLDLSTDGRRNVVLSADPVSIDPHFGFEFGYSNFIFVRGGLGNFQKATDDFEDKTITTFQPNAGIGLVIKNISIDYAFTDLGNQSQALYSHVISLKLDVNKRSGIQKRR